jgi:hypothetical protein
VICGAFALIFGVIAILCYREESGFVKRSVSAVGQVVAVLTRIEEKRDDKGRLTKTKHYQPLVSFADANDKMFEVTGRHETIADDVWKSGMTVRVLYPPAAPAKARIDHPKEMFETFRAMRGMMFVSLIVGVVLFSMAKWDARLESRPKALTGEAARRAFYGEEP